MFFTDEELAENVTIKVEDEAVTEVKGCYIWFSENTPPNLLEETSEEENKAAKIKKRTCVIPGCTNFFFSRKGFPDVPAHLSFHKFPKDENLKRIWKNICQKPFKFSANNSYVCSDHFKPEDFCRNTMAECCKTPRRVNRLRRGTIPTRNLLKLEGQPSCSDKTLAEQDDDIILEEVKSQTEEQDSNSSMKVFKILNVENQWFENILWINGNQHNTIDVEGSWVKLSSGQWTQFRQYSRKKPPQINKEPAQSLSKEVKVESSALFDLDSSNEDKDISIEETEDTTCLQTESSDSVERIDIQQNISPSVKTYSPVKKFRLLNEINCLPNNINVTIEERRDTTSHQSGSNVSMEQRNIQQNISPAIKSYAPKKKFVFLKEKNDLPQSNISIEETEDTTRLQTESSDSVERIDIQQNISPSVKTYSPVKKFRLLNEINCLPNNINVSIREKEDTTSHQARSSGFVEQSKIQQNTSPAVKSYTPVKKLCLLKKNGLPNTNISIHVKGVNGPSDSVEQRDIQQNISPAVKSYTPMKRLGFLKEKNDLPNINITIEQKGDTTSHQSSSNVSVEQRNIQQDISPAIKSYAPKKKFCFLEEKNDLPQSNVVKTDEDHVGAPITEVRAISPNVLMLTKVNGTEFKQYSRKCPRLNNKQCAETKQENSNNNYKLIDLVSSDEEEDNEVRLRKKVSNQQTAKDKELNILIKRYQALEKCFEELKANSSKEIIRLNGILKGKEEKYTNELREALSVFLKPEKVEAVVKETKWC